MPSFSIWEQTTIIVALLVLGGTVFGVILAGSLLDAVIVCIFALMLIFALRIWLTEVLKRRQTPQPNPKQQRAKS